MGSRLSKFQKTGGLVLMVDEHFNGAVIVYIPKRRPARSMPFEKCGPGLF